MTFNAAVIREISDAARAAATAKENEERTALATAVATSAEASLPLIEDVLRAFATSGQTTCVLATPFEYIYPAHFSRLDEGDRECAEDDFRRAVATRVASKLYELGFTAEAAGSHIEVSW